MARIQYIPNRVIDTNGISDGAQVHVYQSGTTTHVALFSDIALTVALPNPLVVPAGAEIPVFYTSYTGQLRLRVIETDGTISQDDDPYQAPIGSGELSGTDGATLIGYKRPNLTSAASRTLQSVAEERFDLRDMNGLDLSGNNDNSSLVETAFSHAADNGVELYVPPGLIVCDSTIQVDGGVNVTGVSMAPYIGAPADNPGKGSVFLFTHSGVGFQVGQANHIQSGVTFRGISTRREQPTPISGWAPNDHDYDISILNTDVIVDDVMLWNATRGILLDEGAAGRLTIGTLRGQVFKTGVKIQKSYDCLFFDLIDFWTFWSNDAFTKAYTLDNLDALHLVKQDGVMGDRLFSIYARSTVRHSSYLDGATNMTSIACKINQVYADQFGKAGVWFDSTSDSSELTIGSMTSQGETSKLATSANDAILFEGNSNKLKVTTLESQASGGPVVSINGSGNYAVIGSPTVYNANRAATGLTAFYAASGNTLEVLSAPRIFGGLNSGNLYGGGSAIIAPDCWNGYTPTVSPSSGAGMTYTIQRAEYQIRGDVVDVEGAITITAAGTVAGGLLVSPPLAVNKGGIGTMRYIVPGVESKSGSSDLADSGTQITLLNADNTTPIKTNSEIRFAVSYRKA